MMLKTKIGSELPEGSIALTKEEALKHQKKYISSWPSKIDVAFLNYGNHMSSVVTLLSSHLILKFFKKELNLSFSPFLYFAYIGSAGIPAIYSYWYTETVLTNSVLIMKKDCFLCQQLKFGFGHLYLSLFYPTTFGYLTYGSRTFIEECYHLPSLKTHPKEFWKETGKILMKGTKTFKLAGLINTFWVFFLPFMQNKQIYDVMNTEVIDDEFSEFDELQHNLQ